MDKINDKQKQYIPIFVGSTYEDLKDYRLAINHTLQKLETIVKGMEFFGAKPGTPVDECIETVRSSTVYVGIFAMRYGSIDEDTGLSFTEIEFREAQKLKLPSLIYLIDENTQPVLPKFVDRGSKGKKLIELKEELKRKFTINYFTTPDDLARKIAEDLPPVLEKIGAEVKQVKKIKYNVTDLLKKFRLRPKKFMGQEFTIAGKFVGDCESSG